MRLLLRMLLLLRIWLLPLPCVQGGMLPPPGPPPWSPPPPPPLLMLPMARNCSNGILGAIPSSPGGSGPILPGPGGPPSCCDRGGPKRDPPDGPLSPPRPPGPPLPPLLLLLLL
uniref:Putative minicollagen 8 n=1 Tax=Anopheles darlingi TaxID=43151 RepID=A0A2M4DR11_ANODA